MRTASRITVSSALIGVALVTTGQDAASQEPGAVAVVARETLDLNALRQWDATVDGMLRSGDLVAMSRLGEQSMRGRVHEYLAQHYRGIPVHGGGVSRQLDSSGVTTSLFGTLHQGTDVDTTPALSGVDVALLLEKMHGGNVPPDSRS